MPSGSRHSRLPTATSRTSRSPRCRPRSIAIPSDTGVGSGSAAGTKVIDHDDASNIGNESMILTHSRAQIEPFDGGVRLVYIADPPDVQALRDEVRLKAEHLKTGRCD